MRCIIFILAVLCCANLPSDSFANSLERAQFEAKINKINRLKPLQNPRYELSKDILARSIVSRQNRVVGDVHDVLIDLNGGTVTTLLTDFDRLHLRQPVFLNYEAMNIAPTNDGYKLEFTEDSLEELYPSLLANIKTASGSEGNIFSLTSILGRDVLTSDHLKIGKIQDVLFDQTGTAVKSAYLNIDYKTIHDEGVAIPFESLSFKKHHDGRAVAIISKAHADAVINFIRQ